MVQLLLGDANLTRSEADLDADMDELLAFERSFAAVIVPEDDRRNNTRLYNKHVFADLYSLLPQVREED